MPLGAIAHRGTDTGYKPIDVNIARRGLKASVYSLPTTNEAPLKPNAGKEKLIGRDSTAYLKFVGLVPKEAL